MTAVTRTLMPARAESRPATPMFRGPLAGQRPKVFVGLAADPWLLLAVAALVSIGVVMVFNVSYFHGEERFGDSLQFVRKHCAAIVLGLVAGVLASRVPSHVYQRAAYPLLLGSLVALVLVLVPGIGVVRGGARRWVDLGLVSLQPSEVAKFALVLYLAASIVRKGERMQTFKLGVVPHALVAGAMAALLLLEPDFGTAALVCSLVVLMLFAGGVRPRHLLLPLVPGIPLGIYVLLAESYRLKRLLGFMSPDADPLGINFQLRQSFIAFGSGGLWGVGLGEGRQKMFYLPAAHTDFIFSVVGETFGFAGAALVLSLYALLIWRGLHILTIAKNLYGALIAGGITMMLLFQIFVNVGMTVGIMPITGVPAPLLSFGGSSMLVTFMAVGLLQSIHAQAREIGSKGRASVFQ
jgi:cell division protein FtsW